LGDGEVEGIEFVLGRWVIKMRVDGIYSRSYLLTGFGIIDADPSVSATSLLVRPYTFLYFRHKHL